MDNIISLAGKFKDVIELRSYCDSQYITLTKQAEKMRALEEEIVHLKNLLATTTQLINTTDEPVVERIILTPEEALIDAQIKILYERSLSLELTLEETKKLDLLLKNKNLLKGQSTAIIGQSRPINKKITDAALILLAKQD